MRVLGLVPARAGSKGVPGKNFRVFQGMPLWWWAANISSEICDWTMVSSDRTIDSKYFVRRPPGLCRDETPMLPVIEHALTVIPADVVVLLQPTQPLRMSGHVRDALALLEDGVDSVVSVVDGPSLDWALSKVNGLLYPYKVQLMDDMPSRRQDSRPTYYRDGTVYVIRRETIERGSLYGENCRALVIPAQESCNIDTEEDWQRAEQMMRARHG